MHFLPIYIQIYRCKHTTRITKCTIDFKIRKTILKFNADEAIDSTELEVRMDSVYRVAMVHIETIAIIAIVGSALLTDIISIILLMALIFGEWFS